MSNALTRRSRGRALLAVLVLACASVVPLAFASSATGAPSDLPPILTGGDTPVCSTGEVGSCITAKPALLEVGPFLMVRLFMLAHVTDLHGNDLEGVPVTFTNKAETNILCATRFTDEDGKASCFIVLPLQKLLQIALNLGYRATLGFGECDGPCLSDTGPLVRVASIRLAAPAAG